MTARTRRAVRRAAVGAYLTAGALFVWSVAAAGHPLSAVFVAVAVLAAGWAGLHATRPRPPAVPGGIVPTVGMSDAELLAVAQAIDVAERPGRHACDTDTTVIPAVPR